MDEYEELGRDEEEKANVSGSHVASATTISRELR